MGGKNAAVIDRRYTAFANQGKGVTSAGLKWKELMRDARRGPLAREGACAPQTQGKSDMGNGKYDQD
jgi:hypothetical protein